MPANDRLPEGTDSIIDDGGDVDREELASETGPLLDETGDDDADAPGSRVGGDTGSGSFNAEGLRSAFFGKVDGLKGEATDKAFAFAQTGKDRATSALDDVVRMVEDAAAELDDKLGAQYGDYARRAAQGIGSFSDSFKDKPVEELFDDARALVQKSPAVAIGAAAAIGFVIARIVRAGIPEGPAEPSGSGGKRGGNATAA